MPPSTQRFENLDRPIPTRLIKQIAEVVIPEFIPSAQEQDSILKSVNALPEEISEHGILTTMSANLTKAITSSKPPKGDGEMKSLILDPYRVTDSVTYKESISGMSYAALSSMAAQCTPIASIINTRLGQLFSFSRIPRNRYALGFRIEREDNQALTESDKPQVRKIEQFILNLGDGEASNKRDHFDGWLKKAGRDRLVYDQVNFERVFTYGGALHEVAAVDSATIRIALRKYLDNDNGKNIVDPQLAYDGRGRGLANINVPDNKRAYLQVMNGQVRCEYEEDEMAFCVFYPRTDIRVAGYGYSELEQMISVVTGILFAGEYNRRFFSAGSSPKGVLNVKGNMNQQQLDGFKKAWLAQLSGLSGSWRTPIVAAENGLEFINMQQTNREMEFAKYQDFLIKIACACYCICPEEINFTSTSSSSGNGAVFESKSELRLKASRDKGLVPLLMFFENMINREIVRFLNPKYRFVFVGLDGGTEAEMVALNKERLKWNTLNEIRAKEDLPPVKYGDVIDNVSYMQAYLEESKQKQADKMLDKQQDFQEKSAEDAFERQQEEAERDDKTNRMQMRLDHKVSLVQAKHPAPVFGGGGETKGVAPAKKAKKTVRKALDEDGWDDEDQELLENELQKAIRLGDFEGAAGILGAETDKVVINLEV